MATIPIEVIVRDAEAPIVPSEDGTNTNITVPDAGTISSNGDTSSSASSIILPAILLVLAIGTIVAMLIHKYHKQKKDKISKKEKFAMAATSTIAVLAATVLVGNLVIPATKAATSDTTDTITPAEDKVSITVTRDSGVAEESIESTATITSTSDFGYKVLLSMAEGVETSNLYLDGNEESEYYIASVEAENEEGAELVDNTWGYALTEDGGYSAVPLVDNAIIVAQGDEPVEAETLSIYYGVKVSSDLPAGTYSGGEVEYTLEAKEPTLSITYMQDFATLSEEDKTALISSMPEGYQFTLKDGRDQKDYFVSKLADGNVWMTQNLDFDIANGGAALNSTNTDIPANWADAGNLVNTYATGVTTWNNSTTAPESYDPGTLYWNGAMTPPTDQETCEEYGGTWQPWGSGVCTGANLTSPTGNSHYHLGNYYNWTAAVAMSDSSSYTTDDTDVNQSICPAGWRLPADTGNKSFDNLVTAAPLTVGVDGNIHANPNYFTYSGFWRGSLSNVGSGGNYWSSVVNGGDNSYYLEFSDASGSLDSHQYRLYRNKGYSVRCVAR